MRVTARITKKDLQKYYFHYTYCSLSGILSVCVGLFTIAAGIFYLLQGNQTGIFFLLIALVYFVYQPVTLLISANKQYQLPVFQTPTEYEIGDEIRIWKEDMEPMADPETGEEQKPEVKVPWKEIRKVVKFRGVYFFYITSKAANLLPVRDVSSEDELERIILEKMNKKKVKGIRRK